MLTKVMIDSNSVGAVPVRSFYVCIACETFPMHVLLQVNHTMHLFVMDMAWHSGTSFPSVLTDT